MARCELHFFLAIVFRSLFVFAFTIPESSDSGFIFLNGSNSEFHCAKGSRFNRRRPHFNDCGGAIRQLNDNHIPGDFHTRGLMDQYRLPVTKAHGTCAVLVDMEDGRKDDGGTWLGISLAATQLNIVCVGTGTFPKNQGGYTNAGLHDGVRVVLMYMPPLNSGLEGNWSAQSNETVFGDVSVS